jgi:MFS family permease
MALIDAGEPAASSVGPQAPGTPPCRRTFVLGVTNGVLFQAIGPLMDTTVVMTVLAQRLVGSETLVGVLLMVLNLGWMWPSLFLPYLLQGRPNKLNWYRWAAVVRIAAMAAIPFVLFSGMPGERPRLAFALLVAALFLDGSAAGVAFLPFMDIVAKCVPVNRRGLFWSLRQGGAAALGIGSAWLVHYYLDPARGLPFPLGYAWLSAIAACGYTLAVVSFCFVYEPRGPARGRHLPFRLHFWRGPRLLRTDSAFRVFSLVRALVSLAQMGLPFLAIYGHQRFHLTAVDTGLWLLPLTVASSLYPFAWGALSDRRGPRALLRVSTALSALASAAPLMLATGAALGLHSHTVFQIGLGAAYLLGRAADSSNQIAVPNYVLEVAPAYQRDAYIGTNTILAIPLSAAPLLAGAIGDHISFEALYAVSLLVGLAATRLAWWSLPRPPRPSLGRAAGE